MAWTSPFDPGASKVTNGLSGTQGNFALATPVMNKPWVPMPSYLQLLPVGGKGSPIT